MKFERILLLRKNDDCTSPNSFDRSPGFPSDSAGRDGDHSTNVTKPWQAQATSPPMARITDSLTLGKLRDMEQVKVKGLLKDGG